MLSKELKMQIITLLVNKRPEYSIDNTIEDAKKIMHLVEHYDVSKSSQDKTTYAIQSFKITLEGESLEQP